MINRKQIDLMRQAEKLFFQAKCMNEFHDTDAYRMMERFEHDIGGECSCAEDDLEQHAHDNSQFGVGA